MPERHRLAFACALAAVFAGCEPRSTSSSAEGSPRSGSETTLEREPLEPLPPAPAADAELVALGRSLFEDKRLSADDSVSCSSCHDLARGGVDGRARSIGVRGQVGGINAPTVFNAGLNFVQFWDGRAATLEEQAGIPITNPVEMGSKWPEVVQKLGRDPKYQAAFAELPGKISPENVSAAIAAFERTLLTHGSPFDRWLGGDATALSPQEKAGYDLFKSVGCIACHQGRNVGGNMFQRFGIFGDYFKDRGNVTEADFGRFNVTRNEADRFVFRVPSLRNVARTAPYLHDGSRSTLPDVVQVMAKYQLGRVLEPAQVDQIVAFLTALSPPEPKP